MYIDGFNGLQSSQLDLPVKKMKSPSTRELIAAASKLSKGEFMFQHRDTTFEKDLFDKVPDLRLAKYALGSTEVNTEQLSLL
jgi:hypothetical protein